MLIFSIYLLVLPGLACAVTDTCTDESEITVTKTANNADHDGEKDDCGSFCTCSCCIHIVSVNFQSPAIGSNKPLLKNIQLSTYYSISLPSNYFGNIWQPPKMS